MGKKNKIAIYLRLSVEDVNAGNEYKECGESFSIGQQRAYLLEYIKNDSRLSECEVVEYCDDGFTGSNMERPGMQEMLKQVRKNQIGCIIVKDMSRFSRDYIEMGTYLNQIFPFMGVDFIAINDRYDSREERGNTIALDTAFQTLIYDLYSKDISIKMKAVVKNKYENGEFVSGQPPLGYERSRNEKNQVVINKKEAEIVRYIFSMAMDGMSTIQIAKRLFEERIPTATQIRYPDRIVKKYNTWSGEHVRQILDNRFYLGEMAYGKTVSISVGSKRRIKVPKSDWKVIKNHHEPLVTPEEFSGVALKIPGHCTKRKREKHPLTGKIYCGGCGHTLNYHKSRSGKNQRWYFGCRQHALLQIPDCCTCISATILEGTILMFLKQELMQRGDMLRQRELLEQFQEKRLKELSVKRKDCKKQFYATQKEKDSLYESYANGQMDATTYRANADQLAEHMEVLSDKIDEIESEYSGIEEGRDRDKWNMKQIIHNFGLTALNREVVDTFIEKVTVFKDKRVEIKWNFVK